MMLLARPLIPTRRAIIHFTLRRLARNYYEVLGLKKTAAEGEIKRAYYELAKKHHPDVNSEPGAAEKFQELTKAYEVLADSRRRDEYDRVGTVEPLRNRSYNVSPQGTAQREMTASDRAAMREAQRDVATYLYTNRRHFVNHTEQMERQLRDKRMIRWGAFGFGAVVLIQLLFLRYKYG